MFFGLQTPLIDMPRPWPGLGLVFLLLSGCSDTADPGASVGSRFPLDALLQSPDLGGDRGTLQGRTLVINFWATWCAPCREEMPLLQQLSDRLDPERYAVVGVSVDEDRNLVQEFLLQYGIRFRTFQDGEMSLARDLLGIVSYPQTFIVSPQGIITARIATAIRSERDLLDKLPRSDPAAPAQTVSGLFACQPYSC